MPIARERVRRIAPPGTKWCPRCQHFHPKSDFSSGFCGPGACDCAKKYHTEWTRTDRKKRTLAMLTETVAAYGGKCTNCGETDPQVLVVVPRGGKGVRALMYRLRKEGYPPGFSLLCRNCEARLGGRSE